MAADGSRRYVLGVDRARRSEVQERIGPFADAVQRPDATLDEMTLLLSQALQPDLDVLGTMTELDVLAADCPTPTRDGVMRFLSNDARFVGDRTDYHRWQNSCLDHVIAHRRGMPITLAVVAIEVGRRVGVRLAGVGLPGHFLVGDPDDPRWFADPFHGRTDLARDDCRNLLVQLGVSRWSDRFLETTPPRLVAARILNNLKVSCERRNDWIRLAIVMQARQALPEFAGEHGAAVESLAQLN
jgi:regulator of sirC expression with transglutaminase-like and TPR domain